MSDVMQSQSPFSIKALLTGTALAIFVGLVGTYGMMHAYAEIGFNPSSPAAIFLFLLITLFVNTALRFASRALAFSKADLVLIYAMMLMSLTVPTWGFLFFLFGTMVWPFYHATEENNFDEIYNIWIPEWIAPADRTAIKHYYEGLPEGMPINWDPWLEPLANWFLFFLAIGFMLICLSTIFHRQWSLHERLTYPMMQLPERMIEEGDDGGLVADFFKSKMMWIGFLLPFCLFSTSGLHHFFPAMPAFTFRQGDIPILEPRIFLPVILSFAWVGFFYLVNLDITFSIWFFFVLFKLERAVFASLGVAGNEVLSAYEAGGTETDLTHQATGAGIVFVLFVVWSARTHLKDVVRKAWRGGRDGFDDSEELLSYRKAVVGFVAGMVFFTFWLWRTGVPVIVIPIVLFVGLCWYILITRVVTGAGVASARGPLVPEFFVISGFGTGILGAKGIVALNFTLVWQGEMRQFAMIACSNALKLAERVRGPKGRLFWGMMIALAATFISGVWMIMTKTHEHGALNLFNINWVGVHGWQLLPPVMAEMPGAYMRGWFFTAVGAVAQFFLVWAQHHWFWWPLHPIGFAIGTGFLTGMLWFSAFVAWMLKATILKLWGGAMYQKMKTFFLGLIVGEASVAGVWWIIFWLMGERGTLITQM